MEVMVTLMMMMPRGRLSQILDVGELAAGGGVREVCCQLVELAGRSRVAVGLGRLSGALQVRGDLLCDLLILGRVRLLQLLQCTQQLSEW